MSVMALDPETLNALEQALDAVVQECGDDPAYADLVDSLTSAQHALQGLEGDGAEKAEADAGQDDGDDYSFDVAAKRMAERRKGAPTHGEDQPHG